MNPDQCELRRVAEEGCCTLARCEDCGRYQLQVGPISVRVPATVVQEIYRCLCAAIARGTHVPDSVDAEQPLAIAPLPRRH